MADKSAIEWTDATWNPIVGCSIVSPGCTHCYAMKMAARIENIDAAKAMERYRHIAAGFLDYGTEQQRADALKALQPTTHYAGTTQASKAGAVWTGKVAPAPDHILTEPLRWKKPRRIFVNSMGDLFHEDVPDEWIDRVFAVMALSPQHTFQVLTKRAKRMRAYLSGFECDGARRLNVADAAGRMMEDGDNAHDEVANANWPLPNVWLGVSAERQQEANERVPDLLMTPAAVRFVSAEPLLGLIDFNAICYRDEDAEIRVNALTAEAWVDNSDSAAAYSNEADGVTGLDWIIVGGESGPGARPMHPAWARSIRDQCQAAGVPFFFKQWGAWKPTSSVDGYWNGPDNNKRQFPNSEGVSMLADGRICCRDFTVAEHTRRIRDRIASSARAVEVDHRALEAFHRSIDEETRQSDNPLGYQWMYCIGKKAAGRMLDGVEHNGMPELREVPAL